MKKAYIIPLVILLLFVSVIPCFATDPQPYQIQIINPFSDYLQNAKSYSSSYTSVSYDSSTHSLTVTILQSGLQNYQLGVYSARCTFYKDRYYLFFVNSDRQLYLQTNSFFAIPTNPYKYPYNNFYARSLLMPGTGATGSYTISQFFAIDVTDLYNAGYTTRTQLVDYLSNYIDLTDYFIPSGSYQIPGYFDPLLDTYSHLLDPFVHVSENFSTYSIFFTFAGIIISVLILIFVTVFLIKRFTGGNT